MILRSHNSNQPWKRQARACELIAMAKGKREKRGYVHFRWSVNKMFAKIVKMNQTNDFRLIWGQEENMQALLWAGISISAKSFYKRCTSPWNCAFLWNVYLVIFDNCKPPQAVFSIWCFVDIRMAGESEWTRREFEYMIKPEIGPSHKTTMWIPPFF